MGLISGGVSPLLWNDEGVGMGAKGGWRAFGRGLGWVLGICDIWYIVGSDFMSERKCQRQGVVWDDRHAAICDDC